MLMMPFGNSSIVLGNLDISLVLFPLCSVPLSTVQQRRADY